MSSAMLKVTDDSQRIRPLRLICDEGLSGFLGGAGLSSNVKWDQGLFHRVAFLETQSLLPRKQEKVLRSSDTVVSALCDFIYDCFYLKSN